MVVFQNTFPILYVFMIPQKHSARTARMKKAAPEFTGRWKVFTKSISD